MKSFIIVQVDYKYCDYLRNYDERVPYNYGQKELRPFIGILFKVGKIEYFAPLSSPKKKHLTMQDGIDFIKIDKGKLGAINFNNMIPLISNCYHVLNTENIIDEKYANLIDNQIRWLNRNYELVCSKAKLLYNLYKNNRLNIKVKKRCCNFLLLEKKCTNYNTKIMA